MIHVRIESFLHDLSLSVNPERLWLRRATICFWPPLSDVIFTVSFQVSLFALDEEVFAEALSVCFVGLDVTRSTILSNLSCVQPSLLRSP